MMSIVPEGRSLLVMGHPGHELRLYGWVGLARPLVCILTDGSGSDGVPRLEKTLEILRATGCGRSGHCAANSVIGKSMKKFYAMNTICSISYANAWSSSFLRKISTWS